MRGKGVQYDTGTFPSGDSTRKTFDSSAVARDMGVIARDLGCNAVRVTGRPGDSVRACPGMPWEPKEAFYTLAEFYSGTARP
ncbi:hypothetical protein [Streptomyces sp. WM6378]|uniref:hypothetical protein n=1 Tax=Streptomyces sp. WM6378 TaxID=1415557 RepID=UPI0006AF8920|nr:hypothetical protein [Streptomyces sp. WM6378]KOU33546.1 hypothetical protein ADK54_41985 [Streptomyces sp. WM6378]